MTALFARTCRDGDAPLGSTLDICGMTRTFHQEHLDAVLASTAVLSKLVNITRPWVWAPPKPMNN